MAELSQGKSKTLQVFLIILLIAAAVAAGYWYTSYQKAQKELERLKNNPSAAAQDVTKRLVDEVGKIIALPENETPTIASIQDKEKLKDQPFFAKAENGDRVLIYPGARKAYLFRESSKKLIEVGTINLQQQQQTNQERKKE